MPTSLHPQAKFDPIPPDLDLHGLVDRTPNFKWVQRVSRSQIRNLGQQEFEKLVLIHVVAGGKPLVIDGWDGVLPKWLFNVDWLEKTYNKQQESVRDITSSSDIPMTMGHYLRSMKQLTNQWTPNNFRDERRQRLYLKDIDCPIEWHDALQKVIHPSLFYLNDNTSEAGGTPAQEDGIFRDEATASPAGDLMSSLPQEMRAENLMCYIGHEGTYTPAHREMCASLGQNIMVEASGSDNGEKPGNSLWFMTESKDREVVREYFTSMLGHDIEIEKHFAQINAWKKAPFDVYAVEQKVGDFILVPPLAAHQVWNRGTRTIKVAWNRTTVETLELALIEALPKTRLVCRDEQYKNKAIIYYSLKKYHEQLQAMEDRANNAQMSFLGLGQDLIKNSPRAKRLASDFKKLFDLFTGIIIDEMFAFREKEVELIPFDSCITCSYCRSNIFNRFLTCKHCTRTLINGDEDAYDVCMECYAMGRSCACLSGLQWCEQWSWSELVDTYEIWRSMVIGNDGYVDFESSPQPLEIVRQRSGKKSVAQICQEALRRRPWKDITKPELDLSPPESEQEGPDGKPKKKKRKKKKGEVRRCHVCCHSDYSYRVHSCANPGCTESYCYGVLYRAFDMMPQQVLEDENWQCPKCLGICNCGYCRRVGHSSSPYTPKNTLLGHDTRPIADERSVEALVDFRVHNLSWLKAAGEESRSKNSRRMRRLQEQADHAKAQDLTHHVEAEHTMPTDDASQDINSGYLNDTAIDEYQNPDYVVDQQNIRGKTGAQDGASQPLQHPDDSHNLDLPSNNDQGPPEDDAHGYPDPDPTLVTRHRIGMGYYEQDDTRDKILFDPFQAPSEEAMCLSEPDVPEFVKKSIRAAKRKVKRENEDPDFVIGRNHHKKSRPAGEPDLLDNMDPALFNSESTGPGSTTTVATSGQHDQAGPSYEIHRLPQPKEGVAPKVPDDGPEADTAMPKGNANEVTLRHAKPMASYVEPDELDMEESEEEEAGPHTLASPSPKTALLGKTEAEMAADAVRALFGPKKPPTGSSEAFQAETSMPPNIPKRRGRPPKSASTPRAHSAVQSAVQAQSSAPTISLNGRRGRPRRSLLSEAVTVDSAISNPGHESDHHRTLSSSRDQHEETVPVPKSQPTNETRSSVALDRSETGDQRPRRRGRPRKSEQRGETQGSLVSDSTYDSPKRQTRENTHTSATAAPSKVNARDAPLLSMAERMALEGKRFIIGKRKPKTAAQSTEVARVSARELSPEPDKQTPGEDAQSSESSSTSQSSPAPSTSHQTRSLSSLGLTTRQSPPAAEIPQLRIRNLPSRSTIVRLVGSDSEEESSGASVVSSSDSDDSEGIPATAPPKTWASRGRGRGQGRGRAGRPRGRGRGRGRL